MEVGIENKIAETGAKREYTGDVTITIRANVDVDAAFRRFLREEVVKIVTQHDKRNR